MVKLPAHLVLLSHHAVPPVEKGLKSSGFFSWKANAVWGCACNQWGLIANGFEEFRSQQQTEGINNCFFQVNGID